MNLETITMSRESDLQCVTFSATKAQVNQLNVEGYSIIRYLGKATLTEQNFYEAWVTNAEQFSKVVERVQQSVA
jgi:hypothetical protein